MSLPDLLKITSVMVGKEISEKNLLEFVQHDGSQATLPAELNDGDIPVLNSIKNSEIKPE